MGDFDFVRLIGDAVGDFFVSLVGVVVGFLVGVLDFRRLTGDGVIGTGVKGAGVGTDAVGLFVGSEDGVEVGSLLGRGRAQAAALSAGMGRMYFEPCDNWYGASTITASNPARTCQSMWQWMVHTPGLSEMNRMVAEPLAGTVTTSRIR